MIITLAALSIILSRGKKRKTDYYNWFLMGVIWLAIGIPFKIYVLIVMGIAFTLAGLVHYKEWDKSLRRKSWNKLSKNEKKMKTILLIILTIIMFSGIIVFMITSA